MSQMNIFGPTLSEARTEFFAARELKGMHCPCCDRWGKLNRRPLSSGIAMGLCWCYKLRRHDWFDIEDIRREVLKQDGFTIVRGNLTIARWWGLLEKKNKEDDENPASGFYRVTEAGSRFVLGLSPARKYAYHYNQKCEGLSEETITIHEALGTKFSWIEVMGSVAADDEIDRG